MMGKGTTLRVVRELFELATLYDVALEFVWQPRTSAVILHADALSRIIDTADFALSNWEFQRLGKRWGFPTADVFAGEQHRFHKCSKYFTLHYTPHTAGVNAMLQDWGQFANSVGVSSISIGWCCHQQAVAT